MSGGGSSTQLGLVAYSTPKKAYDALTTAFAQTAGGKGVSFGSSFGASGSQSRAVDSGQSADVVAFSTTPDMTRLVKDKLVASSWNTNPEKGFSSDSVVVMVVRKGNPKHITGWDPHDVRISLQAGPDTIEAMVSRVIHLGFEVRVEVQQPEGQRANAQLTRDQAAELELTAGDIVYVRPPLAAVAAPAPGQAPAEEWARSRQTSPAER